MSDRAGVDTGGYGGGSGSGWSFGKGCAVAAGIGCIVLIAVLGMCVGGGLVLFKRSTEGATAEIEPFLREIADQRYEAAYDRIAPSWKATVTFDQFREQFATFQKDLGRFESLSVRGLRIESGSRPYREIVYEAQYELGSARIQVRIEKDDDGVERIAGVRTESWSRAPSDVPEFGDSPDPADLPGSDGGAVER